MSEPLRANQVAEDRDRWTRAIAAAAAVVVVATVIPSVLPIFSGVGVEWLVAAVAIPAVVAAGSMLGGRYIDRPEFRAAAAVAALVALLALMPADPEHHAALASLASGPKLLVTAALPVAAGGPQLGFVTVVLVVAAWAAAETAQRTHRALAPLVPTLVVYVAALAVGAGGLPAPRWGALLVAGGAGLFVVLLRALISRPRPAPGPSPAGTRPAGGRPHLAQVVAGAAVLAVAAGLAIPLGDHLPGAGSRQPYNLRAALSAAPRPASQLSLLSSYAGEYDAPPTPVMSVRASGAAVDSLTWRMATYNRFTGTQWVSDDTYQRAGFVLPPDPAVAVATSSVSADVTLHRPTPYLPAPDRPVRVSVPGLDVSAQDGVLAVPSGSPAPLRYQVTSAVPNPGKAQLLAAGPAPRSDRAAPPLPLFIDNLAASLIANAGSSAFSRLTAISAYLTGPQFARHPAGDSPIGSGTYQVLQLLNTRVGSAEQYASAFALLARAVGFDTRVVVGYAGGTVDRRTGAVDFTTRDLTVWPEVQLQGLGWIPFPAVPGTTRAESPAPGSASSGLAQALQEQQQLNAASPPSTVPAPAATPPSAPTGSGPSWAWIAAGVVVGLPIALGVGVAAAKLRRRQSQRGRVDPSARVAGAWEFVVDRLSELGVGIGAALTSAEVVDRVLATLGPACAWPLRDLSETVDATRFDQRFPPRAAAAEDAWRQAEAFDQQRRRSLSRLRRIRSVLSPAPWRR